MSSAANRPIVIPKSTRTRVLRRFLSKVKKTSGCWIWKPAYKKGYGQFTLGNRNYYAHRISWVLAHGSLSAGVLVLHKCDTPWCVRPSHLFDGSHQDNVDDMRSKGRGFYPGPKNRARGERQGGAKLTEQLVLKIKWLLANTTISQAEIGRRLNLHKTTIGYVYRGQSWAHVPTPKERP